MIIEAKLLRELFTHAGSAPSAHNTQPWLPEITRLDDSTAEVTVRVDAARTLPLGDPRSEDLHLAMGCWVESFVIAAAESGLDAQVGSVCGLGPTLEIGLHVRPAPTTTDDDTSPLPAAPGWPGFGTADLRHRQVDRGRLARDDARFEQAMEEIARGLDGSGACLVEIRHSLWRRLLRQSTLYSYSEAAIFAETLEWLRFDRRSPLYTQDGLTAECLRIGSPWAQLAGVMDRRPLHPWIARLASALLSPATLLGSLGPDRRRKRQTGEDVGRGTGPHDVAHHVVLVVADQELANANRENTDRNNSGREDTGRACERGNAAFEVEMGRNLLRIWLLLDRHGLRVDVHSEVKDCPRTHAQLRSHLGVVDTRSAPTRTRLRPIAVFSLGRSTTSVPRSHRLTVQ